MAKKRESSSARPPDGTQVGARNRKAGHGSFWEARLAAGLVLLGTEIKSVRARQVSLREVFGGLEKGGAWSMTAHIPPLEPASRQNHDPRRPRKLLLQRKELARLDEQVSQRGYTVVPIQMLLRGGLAKVEIALARGKRKYDKRREIADRDANREVERALRQRSKG